MYVRFSMVVPAGTVGGSVSSTRKENDDFGVSVGKSIGLVNVTAAIKVIATSTAAPPYFNVHFLVDNLFSSAALL